MSEMVKMLPRYRVPIVEMKTNNKKKTHEQYVEEVKIKNPNIEVLEEYIGSNIKILHKCLNGHTFLAYPSNVLRGHNCKICSQTKTHEQYVLELQEKVPTIKIMDEYAGTQSTNTFCCLVCNNIWEATPSSPLRGKGCPQCRKIKIANKLRHTHEQFLKDLSEINPNIQLLDKYTDSRNPIKSKCLICGKIWNPIAHTLLQGHGCPSCSNSIGEKIISDFLSSRNICYISQHKYAGLVGIRNGLLSYDFYLPDYNLLIEFQGEQHERPVEYFGGEKIFKKQQEHDRRKREYAKQNNINLLEIWYYDIDNIESILLQKNNEIENNLKLESVETAISA